MEGDMVKVRRNLFFFELKQGYLRYSESSPEEKECDHQVCNCTKAVSVRPDGEPQQKQQYIEFIKDQYTVTLYGTGCHFTKIMPGKHYSSWDKDNKWPSNNHAYFWFGENKINIEITKTDFNEVGCFFGHMYLGNKIDISRFFNGHSPSRIVDLSKIGSNELWMHYNGFSSEKMISLPECEETTRWHEVFTLQKEIAEKARTYEADYDSLVVDIRKRVENETEMLEKVETLCEWFDNVLTNLDKTEMFACGKYCYEK